MTCSEQETPFLGSATWNTEPEQAEREEQGIPQQAEEMRYNMQKDFEI